MGDEMPSDDALRGWAHLSLWAHYGGGGTGICIEFDKRKLIERFMTTPQLRGILRFHGPIHYRYSGVMPIHAHPRTRQAWRTSTYPRCNSNAYLEPLL
ncbi:DUF2971 domain-containing protein [Actinomadura syzygii]|uniref:DUF2971 domain-containing protein n=1 Tax=Actinomadura syzygii TaxID=1427538 RepID=A0A5D0TNW7_9ACTN|nr:DUF2971 domain-containing protein [Actinomadura syzygii]TYC07554.1 DUF2971 domain-containing protein [Actinomadura syzygii]